MSKRKASAMGDQDVQFTDAPQGEYTQDQVLADIAAGRAGEFRTTGGAAPSGITQAFATQAGDRIIKEEKPLIGQPGLRYGFKRRRGKNNQISPKVARYLYRTRQRRHVPLKTKIRMQAMGRAWQPILRKARAIARSTRNSGRITRKDVALARREMGEPKW